MTFRCWSIRFRDSDLLIQITPVNPIMIPTTVIHCLPFIMPLW